MTWTPEEQSTRPTGSWIQKWDQTQYQFHPYQHIHIRWWSLDGSRVNAFRHWGWAILHYLHRTAYWSADKMAVSSGCKACTFCHQKGLISVPQGNQRSPATLLLSGPTREWELPPYAVLDGNPPVCGHSPCCHPRGEADRHPRGPADGDEATGARRWGVNLSLDEPASSDTVVWNEGCNTDEPQSANLWNGNNDHKQEMMSEMNVNVLASARNCLCQP